ncbi:malate:quinone oxidoreductase, partial [Burkholderia multivorans]
RQYWSHLVDTGVLPEPKNFINQVPHISYGRGEKGRDYIRNRREQMVRNPLFAEMEYTDDPATQAEWLPLMFEGRGPGQVNGISRTQIGTDVDFGSLSRQLLRYMADKGATIRTSHQLTDLDRSSDGWTVTVRDLLSRETHKV